MKKIIESGIEVRDIDIYIMFKNNENYVRYFFENFNVIEKKYDVNFRYFVLENDSEDLTCETVKHYMRTKIGNLVYPGNSTSFDKMNRLRRMAHLRNTLVRSNTEKNSNWSLIIDSDVYFDEEIVEKLFSSHPSQNKIGMVCAYGLEFYGEYSQSIKTLNHYYDTYTYIDDRNTLYWPHCIFENCAKCQPHRNPDNCLRSAGVQYVKSAFGGFVAIKSSLLNNPQIFWESIEHNNMFLCEHIGLCTKIRNIAGEHIAINCDAKVYWQCPTTSPKIV